MAAGRRVVDGEDDAGEEDRPGRWRQVEDGVGRVRAILQATALPARLRCLREGPFRNACLNCGSCMTGCRHNAKNTLDKNYLYLAEKNGAQVHPLTTVTRVRPLDSSGYAVEAVHPGCRDRVLARPRRTHPHRTGPLRQGQQAMGLLQTALTDGGKRWRRWVTWLLTMLNPRDLTWPYVRRWSGKTIILLVMQTLDKQHHRVRAQAVRAVPAHLRSWARRPEPDLDPGRQRRHSARGEEDQGPGRGHPRRDCEHPHDRPLHRRLCHRRLVGNRRHRPIPAPLRPPRPGLHVATAPPSPPTSASTLPHHHRAGRTRYVLLTQQWRHRPPATARRRLHSREAGASVPSCLPASAPAALRLIPLTPATRAKQSG